MSNKGTILKAITSTLLMSLSFPINNAWSSGQEEEQRITTQRVLAHDYSLPLNLTINNIDDAKPLLAIPEKPFQKLGRSIIRKIAHDENHQERYKALSLLLEKESKEEDKIFSRDILFSILLTPHHNQQMEASEVLFNSRNKAALIGARKLIELNSPLKLQAASKLEREGESGQDKEIAFSVYRELTNPDVENGKQFEAARSLLRSNKPEDKNRALEVYRRLAQEADIPADTQFEIALKLRETKDDMGLVLNIYRMLITHQRYQLRAAWYLWETNDETNRQAALDVFNTVMQNTRPKDNYGDDIKLANILFESNVYKETACCYYKQFIESDIGVTLDIREELYTKLLDSGIDEHRQYALNKLRFFVNHRASKDQIHLYSNILLFSFGDPEDKSLTRSNLRGYVSNQNYSKRGPQARAALAMHGNDEDKAFINAIQ